MIVRLVVNLAAFESLDISSNERDNIFDCQKDIKQMIDFYSNYFPKVMTYKRIFDKDNLTSNEILTNNDEKDLICKK